MASGAAVEVIPPQGGPAAAGGLSSAAARRKQRREARSFQASTKANIIRDNVTAAPMTGHGTDNVLTGNVVMKKTATP